MKKLLIFILLLAACESSNESETNLKTDTKKGTTVKVKRKTKNKTSLPIMLKNNTVETLVLEDYSESDRLLSKTTLDAGASIAGYLDDEVIVLSDKIYYDSKDYSFKVIVSTDTLELPTDTMETIPEGMERAAIYKFEGSGKYTLYNESSFNIQLDSYNSLPHYLAPETSVSMSEILLIGDSLKITRGLVPKMFTEKTFIDREYVSTGIGLGYFNYIVRDISSIEIKNNIESSSISINKDSGLVEIRITPKNVENGYAVVFFAIDKFRPYQKVQNWANNMSLKKSTVANISNNLSFDAYYADNISVINTLPREKGTYKLKAQVWGANISGTKLGYWGTLTVDHVVE
jgi:hypothetical protein